MGGGRGSGIERLGNVEEFDFNVSPTKSEVKIQSQRIFDVEGGIKT